MSRRHRVVAACLLVPGFLGCAGSPDTARGADSVLHGEPAAPAVAAPLPITSTSMGGIELGATLGDIRRRWPAAKFERGYDGEGVALIGMTLGPDTTLILWAGEDDADAAIDWSQRVRMIETQSPAFATAEGVRAGMRVTDVAKAYGPVREVMESEIESRQYITFERQPVHLILRLDYTGVFAAGERTTKVVAPEGAIHSIAIAAAEVDGP